MSGWGFREEFTPEVAKIEKEEEEGVDCMEPETKGTGHFADYKDFRVSVDAFCYCTRYYCANREIFTGRPPDCAKVFTSVSRSPKSLEMLPP